MAGFESRIMCGRGPDGTPRVIELDGDGYLDGIATLLSDTQTLLSDMQTILSDMQTVLTLCSSNASSLTILDGSGAYPVFRITGDVQINHIWGHVEEATPAGTTAASLQLFPTGGVAIPITSFAGSDISNLPIGSLISKSALAAVAITVSDNSLGFISEQTGFIFSKFAIGQQVITVTHIRFNVTEANASGAIHWHCDWEALSEDGNVEAA